MTKSNNPSVLYLGPPPLGEEISDIVRSLTSARLCTTHDVARAEQLIKDANIAVGLVHLDANNASYSLESVKALTTRETTVSWVGLVAPEELEHMPIARLIADWFCDYQTSPIDPQRLVITIAHAQGMNRLRKKIAAQTQPSDDGCDLEMVGASSTMMNLFATIRKVAQSSAPVFITGESGTGKELVARAIHERSRFANGPFVPINCGAIPPTLIESELYGYERGAFTGAYKRKIGMIETGSNGTVFLDEIGELIPSVQTSLLRFLQEKTIQRVGGNVTFPVETRIVAATNVNIAEAVKDGRFREDLFFRLGVLQIEVPPLRDRGADAELLARYYLRVFAREEGRKSISLSKDAHVAIASYDWPGNVRELINRIRRALVMSTGDEIRAADLGLAVPNGLPTAPSLDRIRRMAEIEGIRRALIQSDFNWSKAAMLLRVSRGTLYRLADRHGMSHARNDVTQGPISPNSAKN